MKTVEKEITNLLATHSELEDTALILGALEKTASADGNIFWIREEEKNLLREAEEGLRKAKEAYLKLSRIEKKGEK